MTETVEKLLDETTTSLDDEKKRKEKRKKDIKESIEVTIDWLNKNKNDVDALIVLAINDQEADENDAKDGLGVTCGGKLDLLNLIANIDKDLMSTFIMAKLKDKLNENHDN